MRPLLALVAHPFPAEAGGRPFRCLWLFPLPERNRHAPLLGQLAGEGWTTALPIVIARLGTPLEFRRWMPGEPTMPGKWDIPRPPEEAPLVKPDVLLVPLLAFDRKGYRLGYGGGFYDRTLEMLREPASPLWRLALPMRYRKLTACPMTTMTRS